MAEEYNRTVNWWDSTATSSSSIVDSVSSSCSSVVFPQDPASHHLSLQIMGLGLSSQPLDHWTHHQTLLRRGDKAAGEMSGGGFRSMLQDGMVYGSAPQKLFLGGGGSTADEPTPEFKPIKGYSLDQFSHTSSVDSCSQGLPSPTFLNPLDSSSSSVYGSPNSNLLQGMMGSTDQDQHQHQQSGYGYHQANYGVPPGNPDHLMCSSNWGPTKVEVPQFLKTSMVDSKHIQPHLTPNNHGSYWNMVAPAGDPRPAAFFPMASPLLQTHQMITMPSFEEKPKHNMMEVRETTGAGRKSSGGSDQVTTTSTTSTAATTKRSRNEASSTLPPFKVRKEKMGDRITALQQLVSPFGKTDTASVLSEAIEYIKFLHEQVNVLSTPYLKSGASMQHQQSGGDKSKDPEGPRQDLRSRGLCLVPVSSTFPVAHETTVDFWTPTFGGTFR